MSTIKKILVSTDFSEQSLAGLRQAADLARQVGGEVVVLYVVEDRLPPILGTATVADRREILEKQREGAAEELSRYAAEHVTGCPVETATAVGVPSREIVDAARARGVDLIVIASHGYGPLRQLLIGSTAERVLHHASCPVLVVPSKED